MKIQLNKYSTAAFATMLLAFNTACKKPINKPVNYTPIAKEYVQPRVTAVLNSLCEQGEKIASDPKYIYLGTDTLKLNKDFDKNPDKFMQNANMIFRDKFNDAVFTTEENCIFDNANRIGSRNYFYLYTNTTPVISSPNLYTTDTTSKTTPKTIYVPVECYAQANPNFL